MGTIKCNTIEEALAIFEKSAAKHGEASFEGQARIANYNYDRMAKVVSFLKSQNSLAALSIFYSHPNIAVRSWAAAYLLPVYEKKSIKILKEIVKLHVFGSLDAEMTIKEWKNGNLKNFYTVQ